MKPLIKLKTTTLLVIPLVVASFALLPSAQAETPSAVIPFPFVGTNTFDGFLALDNNTGIRNSAFGSWALQFNTSGDQNTAVGAQALRFNTTASFNTAIGDNALLFNTTGTSNMALGQGALANNLTGSNNTAMGFQALNAQTSDTENVAVGRQALRGNAGGDFNTAVGTQALLNQTTGDHNNALGEEAGVNVSTGSSNVLIGSHSGSSVTNGSGIVCLGASQNSDNISNRTFIKNVGGTVQPFINDVIEFVTVNVTNNKMGRQASSRRYKEDIKPMEKSSELIYQLKPAKFRYKKTAEYPNPGVDYGLIAEDVAEVAPELAIRNGEGQIESLRYMAIYNMMLNEFLKEHKKVQELEATVAQQKKGMELLAAQLKEQASQIQKVSDRVELNKAEPRTVANK